MKFEQPSIRVDTTPVADEATIPIGQSKIGGRPDLPPDVEWASASPSEYEPHLSMPFIAQLNLKELNSFDVENLLPPQGMLYFFAGVTVGKVIFIDDPSPHLERREFPDDIPVNRPLEWGERYAPCTVTFVRELNLYEPPVKEKLDLKKRSWWHNLHKYIVNHFNQPYRPYSYRPRPVVNRIFGAPFDVPVDLRFDCQFEADLGNRFPTREDYANTEAVERAEQYKEDWQLLLAVDSDLNAGMMWSDVGVICYYIRLEDLKRRHFSNICFTAFSG